MSRKLSNYNPAGEPHNMLLTQTPAIYDGKAVTDKILIITEKNNMSTKADEDLQASKESADFYNTMLAMDLEHSRYASFFYTAEEKRVIRRRLRHRARQGK